MKDIYIEDTEIKGVLALLNEMGAKNINYDQASEGQFDTTLTFEYNGKVALLRGTWMNTGQACIRGKVEKIG